MSLLQWTDKYSPLKNSDNKLLDILDDQETIQNITEWISVFKDKTKWYPDFKNAILLWGPTGSGKSVLANSILKEFNYNPISFTSEDIRSEKAVYERITEILGFNNVMTLMAGKPKNGIIIDELDSIDNKDKTSMNTIKDIINYSKNSYGLEKKIKEHRSQIKIKSIETKKTRGRKPKEATMETAFINNLPIILICNSLDKSIKSILGDVVTIRVSPPNKIKLSQIIDRISLSENFTISPEAKIQLMDFAGNDYRRLIIILENLFHISHCGKEIINTSHIERIKSIIDDKTLDIGLLEGVERVLRKPMNIWDNLQCYYLDIHFMPLILHENFIPNLDKNFVGSNDEKLDLTLKYYNNLISSYTIKENLFGNWELTDYIGILSTASANIFSNSLPLKSKLGYEKIDNSAIISKYNYRFFNLKILNGICKKLNIGISSWIELSNYLWNIINEENWEILKEEFIILLNKGLESKEIEKILRLNPQLTLIDSGLYTYKIKKKIADIFKIIGSELNEED
jgi:DNA polymerase III delta prime subunit